MVTNGKNNCSLCIHSEEAELTVDLVRGLQCRLNPPAIIAITTQQGVQMMAMYPVVNSEMSCSKISKKIELIK